jgi:multicomponent Na+:H+ antiporter subunit D
VFAGLLTKVGIYAIIRTQTLLFPGGFSTLLMIVGLATMLVGILGAVAQNEIKRLLSFTLVSHIGFLIFGIAIGSPQGLAATVFYVAHHILVQTALFLAAGLIEHITGTTKLDRLGALARTAPALAILFFIPAMNLGGVPPFSGLIGKVGLFEAGLAAGGSTVLVLVAGGALTSLLTLYAIVRVWGRAFWRPAPARDHDGMAGLPVGSTAHGSRRRPPAVRRRRRLPQEIETRGDARSMPVGMVGATLVVVLAGLALTVAAGPIYGYADRAGHDLSQPSVYIDAVLGAP